MNNVYLTIEDQVIDLVLNELYQNKLTPQDIGYILAKNDLERNVSTKIAYQLSEAEIVKTLRPVSKVMLTQKGIEVIEKGGWNCFKENPLAFEPEPEAPEQTSFFTKLLEKTSNSISALFL